MVRRRGRRPRAARRGGATARQPRSGFTVVELLVVVVILALIAVLVIPLLLSTLQVGKQKRTMSDINLIGKAIMSWVNDQLGAAAAGSTTVPITQYGPALARDELEALLVPQYCRKYRSSTPGAVRSSTGSISPT